MTADTAAPRPRRGRRPRGMGAVAAAALPGAAAVAGAGLLTWGSASYVDTLSGPFTRTVTGNQVQPELGPIALAVVAGLGAALATRGRARRVVGLGVLLAGLLVAVRALTVVFGPEPATLHDLPRPATQIGEADVAALPPSLAVLGALMIMLAGAVLLVGRTAGGGLGSRYERGGYERRGSAPRRPADGAAGADAAGLDLWKSLDADSDPTSDPRHGSDGGRP